MRDPLFQRRLMKERSRTQAKHSHTSRKCQWVLKHQNPVFNLGQLVNVSISKVIRTVGMV